MSHSQSDHGQDEKSFYFNRVSSSSWQQRIQRESTPNLSSATTSSGAVVAPTLGNNNSSYNGNSMANSTHDRIGISGSSTAGVTGTNSSKVNSRSAQTNSACLNNFLFPTFTDVILLLKSYLFSLLNCISHRFSKSIHILVKILMLPIFPI